MGADAPEFQLEGQQLAFYRAIGELLYFQERIFVYVAEGALKTDHSFYLAGQRFLTLHYQIERLAKATA